MSKQLVVLDTAGAACCPPITEASLGPEQAVDLVRMFKALGDPIRLRLLSCITSAPDGEICVCDITGGDFDVSGLTPLPPPQGATRGRPHRRRAPRHLGLLPTGGLQPAPARRNA